MTMTKREAFVQAIAEVTSEELKTYFETELTKMDATNAKRREKSAEKAGEKVEAVKAFVTNFVGETAETASTLMAKMVAAEFVRADGKELNVQFVSAMARKAVELGLVVQTEVKVTGKGMQKAYARA